VANQENESIEPSFIESVEKALRDDQALVKSYEGNQGILFKLNLGDKNYLVKRANKTNVFLRYFNQRTLNRELEIYKKLKGIDGIPDCFGMTVRGELILEYIEGQSYRDKQYELAGDESFFQKLLDLILNMHNEGVAHGDLKRKDNILVNKDNEPFLIDFGTGISIDKPKGQIKRSIFRFLKSTDLNAWVKHKYNRNYDGISEDDRQYYSPTLIEKCYRIIRKIFVKYG
jgi:tRNA A-37 threonylcarbamoyl transferase component Bud32